MTISTLENSCTMHVAAQQCSRSELMQCSQHLSISLAMSISSYHEDAALLSVPNIIPVGYRPRFLRVPGPPLQRTHYKSLILSCSRYTYPSHFYLIDHHRKLQANSVLCAPTARAFSTSSSRYTDGEKSTKRSSNVKDLV